MFRNSLSGCDILQALGLTNQFCLPGFSDHHNLGAILDKLHPLRVIVCSNWSDQDFIAKLESGEGQSGADDIDIHAQGAIEYRVLIGAGETAGGGYLQFVPPSSDGGVDSGIKNDCPFTGGHIFLAQDSGDHVSGFINQGPACFQHQFGQMLGNEVRFIEGIANCQGILIKGR